MNAIRLRAVGNSTGLVLPKETLARYNLSEGDTVQLIEGPDGLLLAPVTADSDEQIALGRELMKRYRETFAALAK